MTTTKELFIGGIILGTFLAFFASLKIRNLNIHDGKPEKRKNHSHMGV